MIKRGSYVVWGLVSDEVLAKVNDTEIYDSAYKPIADAGYQVVETERTDMRFAVKVVGEARRWGMAVAKVEVRMIDTVVIDGAIYGAVGEVAKVRNPVVRKCNVEAN